MSFIKKRTKLLDEIIEKKKIDKIIIMPSQRISSYFLKEKAKTKSDIKYWIYPPPSTQRSYNKTIEKIRERKLKVGMYLDDVPYKTVKQIKKLYAVVDISHIVNEARKIKTQDEINKIKKACQINKKIYENVILHYVFSEKEINLANKITIEMIKYKTKPSFPTIMAYGKNTSFIHHIPTSHISKDIALIDFGAEFEGYTSDITITISNKKQYSQAIEDVKNTLEILEDYAREGTSFKELTKIAEQSLKKYKKAIFSNYHYLGHGVGIEVHELPSFNSEGSLQKNMVVALEPAIYIKGKYGVRIERTYRIRKEKKAQNLCF